MVDRYAKHLNHPKGMVKTFKEYGSVLAAKKGLTIAGMVASVVSGSGVTIQSQAYSAGVLSFQLNFNDVGTTIIKVTTTYTGSDEANVKLYKAKTLDDGEGFFPDYV